MTGWHCSNTVRCDLDAVESMLEATKAVENLAEEFESPKWVLSGDVILKEAPDNSDSGVIRFKSENSVFNVHNHDLSKLVTEPFLAKLATYIHDALVIRSEDSVEDIDGRFIPTTWQWQVCPDGTVNTSRFKSPEEIETNNEREEPEYRVSGM